MNSASKDQFEDIMLPHLNAVYTLARWLTRNEHDARDVLQESYLRAFRFFDSYEGGAPKAWLLATVRNTHAPGSAGKPRPIERSFLSMKRRMT